MASTISITSMKVPNPLTQGKGVAVTGTVSSNYTLVSVTASIINTSGAAVYTKNVVPGTLSYNLINMDSYLLFDKLTPGDYSYTVWAVDSSNAQASYNSNFTVVAAASSTLSITSMTVPNPLTQGKGVAVTGTVSSNYTLTNVTASIISSSSTVMYTKSVAPGTLSYNMVNMDSYMLFDKLTPGNYSYVVTASDSSNAQKSYNSDFTVVATASSTLSITSMTVPNPLTQGKGVYVTGTVSSNYTLTNVTASIVSSSNTVMYTKSVAPGTLSYNMVNMDSYMLFDKLTPGDYSYVVTASDSSNTQKSYNSDFTVVATASSTLSITSMTVPNPLTQGKGVAVTGTVSSNYTLTNVTASIVSSSGTVMYTKNVAPGTLSYNMVNMDSYMLFDKLAPGNYSYVVTASDSSNTQKSYNSDFTVVAAASSTLSITGSMSIPNPLTQGKGVYVTGTVSSNYTLTNVTASIISSSSTVMCTKSAAPGTLSYNMVNMDSYMLFDKLAPGNYSYVVSASDSSGTTATLVNTAFAVSPQETPTGNTSNSNYSKTLEEALDIQMTCSPQKSNGSSWVNASKSDVRNYLTPSNYNTGASMYQFLDLSKSAGITKSAMESFLSNKGILAGQAETYLAATQKYGVSEVYLVAHSCLETGNGTSTLATGVVYNGVTVYNMYGIGAIDSDPIGGGSKKAYEMGWTTPALAIEGGAKWISEQYINCSYQQNTLYKMRWNPANPGTHQYATDIHWAIAQTNRIKSLYDQFPNAILNFDIPVYAH